jgi:hypothetical protein
MRVVSFDWFPVVTFLPHRDRAWLRCAPYLVGQCPIGQGFSQVDATDGLSAVEIGKRPGDPQHAMVSAC